MVAIFGDITGKDDYTHPLGPESNFNESMYFNFFDRARKSGGFVRLGNRANEGYAEMTLDAVPARRQRAVPVQAAGDREQRRDGRRRHALRGDRAAARSCAPTYEGARRPPEGSVADGGPARCVQEQPVQEGEARPHPRGGGPRVRQHRREPQGRRSREGVRQGALRAAHEGARHRRGRRRGDADRRPRPARPLVGAALLAGDPLATAG